MRVVRIFVGWDWPGRADPTWVAAAGRVRSRLNANDRQLSVLHPGCAVHRRRTCRNGCQRPDVRIPGQPAGNRRGPAAAQLDRALRPPRPAADGLPHSRGRQSRRTRPRHGQRVGFRQSGIRPIHADRVCRPGTGLADAMLLESESVGQGRPRGGLEPAGPLVDGLAQAGRLARPSGSPPAATRPARVKRPLPSGSARRSPSMARPTMPKPTSPRWGTTSCTSTAGRSATRCSARQSAITGIGRCT